MIEYIGIENFRNHKEIRFDIDNAKIIVFCGRNGIGKTNLLEAISIIDGSKGLKGSKINELKQINELKSNLNQQEFKICIDVNGNRIILESIKSRKKFKLNRTSIPTFYEVTEIINTIWTSPDLEYLFFSSQKTRRDFFDKLTFCFFKNHYKLLNDCDDLLSQRLKILVENISDGFKVIDNIELEIAKLIYQIVNNRINAISMINNNIDKTENEISKFSISCLIKYLELDIFKNNSLDNTIAKISSLLKSQRLTDAATKQNSFSHNKFTINMNFENNNDFNLMSSGQIKFVLISICFAFAKTMKQNFPKRTIILLLDDFMSKLDYKNSQILLAKLEQWDYGQVFITSTSGLSIKQDNLLYKIFNL